MNKLSTEKYLKTGDLSTLTTYKVGVLEASVHRNLQKYCEITLKQYSLTKMHWMLIGTVLESGPDGIRLTDLAKQLGTTMSYITVSVNLLSSRGILQRVDSEKDSRSTLVSVDKKYLKTCEEIELVLRKSLRKAVYSHVSPEDLRAYLKVMMQLSSIKPTE